MTKVRNTFYTTLKVIVRFLFVFFFVCLFVCLFCFFFLQGFIATLFFSARFLFIISFLSQISIKDMKERTFEFPVKDWIDAKEGVFAQAEYALSSNGFHDEPIKPPVKPDPFGLSE